MTAEDVTARPATAGPVQPLVQLTNICKYFLGVTALEDINLP
ncbi:MAG: hypothetical protein QOI68_3236, partial [Pseudonocardiales bacterium]|nr:hypothetical protein [Pseudonocardiales bacterium]